METSLSRYFYYRKSTSNAENCEIVLLFFWKNIMKYIGKYVIPFLLVTSLLFDKTKARLTL